MFLAPKMFLGKAPRNFGLAL